jgi:tRNA wybutosine-synthesizing protein 1
MPEVIERLDPLPDQLYVTIAAPEEETYRKLCIPLNHDNWARINRTLQILPSLDTRKVVRHTLVKGYNMSNVGGYASLDKIAEPDFIECKAYMFVGYSREIMSLSNMPSHEDVTSFSAELSMKTGYALAGEKVDSRVVLLDAGSKNPRSLAHS